MFKYKNLFNHVHINATSKIICKILCGTFFFGTPINTEVSRILYVSKNIQQLTKSGLAVLYMT